MAKLIVLDEIHVSFRISSSLAKSNAKQFVRILKGRRFQKDFQHTIAMLCSQLLRSKQVRVSISR